MRNAACAIILPTLQLYPLLETLYHGSRQWSSPREPPPTQPEDCAQLLINALMRSYSQYKIMAGKLLPLECVAVFLGCKTLRIIHKMLKENDFREIRLD